MSEATKGTVQRPHTLDLPQTDSRLSGSNFAVLTSSLSALCSLCPSCQTLVVTTFAPSNHDNMQCMFVFYKENSLADAHSLMMQLGCKRKWLFAAGEQRYTHIHSTHLSMWFALVMQCVQMRCDAMRTDAQMHRCRWFGDAMRRQEKFMRLVNRVTHSHTAPFRLWFHLMEHRRGSFLSNLLILRNQVTEAHKEYSSRIIETYSFKKC